MEFKTVILRMTRQKNAINALKTAKIAKSHTVIVLNAFLGLLYKATNVKNADLLKCMGNFTILSQTNV